jgi:hypothetical protein
VISEVSYFSGSPLSGPIPGISHPENAGEALSVEIYIAALEEFPDGRLKPLESFARLVASSRGGKSIRPTANLARTSRLLFLDDDDDFIAHLEGGAFGRTAPVARLYGVLPTRITAAFSLRSTEVERYPLFDEPFSINIELQIHRTFLDSPREGIELALVMEDLVSPLEKEITFSLLDKEEEEDEKVEEVPEELPAVLQREFVMLDAYTKSLEGQLALFFPSPFSEPARTLAAVIRVGPAPKGSPSDETRHAEAFARCRADLEHAAEEADGVFVRAPSNPTFWPGIDEVLESLSKPGMQRTVLLFLASSTKARLVEDIALSASDVQLESMAKSLIEELRQHPVDEIDGFAWMLEKTAFQLLLEFMAEEGMTPAIEGVLARRAGEAGRDESVLEEIIEKSPSLEEFEEQLGEINFLYLEDQSPAARTRAFDWLVLKDRAPQGYDPLAPLMERRKALAESLEESEAGNEDAERR